KDVRLLFRRAGGQIVAVIRPGDIEKSRSGIGYIVVAHVHRVDEGIAAGLRKRCRSADGGARRKCYCRAGDGADAAIILKEVVTDRVFLAAVIEDANPVTTWCDYHIRLPLVGSGAVIVYRHRRTPSGATICGLHEKDVRLVPTARGLVVSHIDVAAHRVDRRVRERVAPETRGPSAVHRAGETQVAVDSGREAGNNRDR